MFNCGVADFLFALLGPVRAQCAILDGYPSGTRRWKSRFWDACGGDLDACNNCDAALGDNIERPDAASGALRLGRVVDGRKSRRIK